MYLSLTTVLRVSPPSKDHAIIKPPNIQMKLVSCWAGRYRFITISNATNAFRKQKKMIVIKETPLLLLTSPCRYVSPLVKLCHGFVANYYDYQATKTVDVKDNQRSSAVQSRFQCNFSASCELRKCHP